MVNSSLDGLALLATNADNRACGHDRAADLRRPGDGAAGAIDVDVTKVPGRAPSIGADEAEPCADL
jgi:hypothetical protein